MMNTENKHIQEFPATEKKLVIELLKRITELSDRLEKLETKLGKPLIS